MTSRRSLHLKTFGVPITPVDHFHDENDFGIPQTPPMCSHMEFAKPSKDKAFSSNPSEAPANVNFSTLGISTKSNSDSSLNKIKFTTVGQIPVAVPTPQSICSHLPAVADNSNQTDSSELYEDISLQHGRNRSSSQPASLLEMYEKAKGKNRQRHSSADGKMTVKNETISNLKNQTSQSLPPSPTSTPESLRKRLGSLDTQLRKMKKKESVHHEGSILSRMTGMFHPSLLEEKNEIDFDFENEKKTENRATDSTSAVKSFMNWGTQTKVQVSNKDLNMFAPSST
ncbi:hypothetical protein ScPMuIL_000513 [Solemya velum]